MKFLSHYIFGELMKGQVVTGAIGFQIKSGNLIPRLICTIISMIFLVGLAQMAEWCYDHAIPLSLFSRHTSILDQATSLLVIDKATNLSNPSDCNIPQLII
jgi:hypothetical protein